MNSTQTILKYLETKQIVHGIAKKQINCSEIAADLRNQYGNITWVSARIKGTRLLISIQENMIGEAQMQKDSTPCSIIADAAGTIIHMVTRRGVPQLSSGQTCQPGDLLVLGRVEICNDSQEVIRYEYVDADADIFLQRNISYSDEFPLQHSQRVYTGQNHRKLCLQCLDYRITIGLPGKKYKGYDIVCIMRPLQLTENYILPLANGFMEEREYRTVIGKYSQEEAKQLAGEHLDQYFEKLSEKGVKISKNNVKISISNGSCTARGTLTIVEKCGKKVPVERLAEPEERTLVDEQ